MGRAHCILGHNTGALCDGSEKEKSDIHEKIFTKMELFFNATPTEIIFQGQKIFTQQFGVLWDGRVSAPNLRHILLTF